MLRSFFLEEICALEPSVEKICKRHRKTPQPLLSRPTACAPSAPPHVTSPLFLLLLSLWREKFHFWL